MIDEVIPQEKKKRRDIDWEKVIAKKGGPQQESDKYLEPYNKSKIEKRKRKKINWEERVRKSKVSDIGDSAENIPEEGVASPPKIETLPAPTDTTKTTEGKTRADVPQDLRDYFEHRTTKIPSAFGEEQIFLPDLKWFEKNKEKKEKVDTTPTDSTSVGQRDTTPTDNTSVGQRDTTKATKTTEGQTRIDVPQDLGDYFGDRTTKIPSAFGEEQIYTPKYNPKFGHPNFPDLEWKGRIFLPPSLKTYFEEKTSDFNTPPPLPEEKPYFDEEGNIKRDKHYSNLERVHKRFETIKKEVDEENDRLMEGAEYLEYEVKPKIYELEKKINNGEATPEEIKKHQELVDLYNSEGLYIYLKSGSNADRYNKAVKSFEEQVTFSKERLKRFEELQKKFQSGDYTQRDLSELMDIAAKERIPMEGVDISETGNFFRSIWNAVPHLIGEAVKGVGYAHEFLNKPNLNPNYIVPPNWESPIKKLGKGIKDKFSLTTNPIYAGETGTHIASGLGSSATFYAGGIGSRLLKIPAMLAPAALGGLSQASGAYEEAKFKGADEKTARLAYFMNLGLGATEAIPVANLFGRLDKKTKGLFSATFNKLIKSKPMKEGVEQSLEEIIQETFNAVLSNLTASDILKYDIERDIFEGVKEGTISGGTVGFIMGFLTKKLQLAVEKGEIKKEEAEKRIKEMEKVLASLKPQTPPETPPPTPPGTPPKRVLLLPPHIPPTPPPTPPQKTSLNPKKMKFGVDTGIKDEDVHSIISAEVKRGMKKQMVVDTTELEKLAKTVKDQKVREKIDVAINNAKEHNEKITSRVVGDSVERVSLSLFNKPASQLTDEEAKAVFAEYDKRKQEAKKKQQKLPDVYTPSLSKRYQNHIQKVEEYNLSLPTDEEANTVIGEVNALLGKARSDNKLVDTNEILSMLEKVANPNNIDKINNVLAKVDGHNNKLNNRNKVTLDNLARKKFNKSFGELKKDQQNEVRQEFNVMTSQGITEFSKLETITIKGKENAIQEQTADEISLQPKPEGSPELLKGDAEGTLQGTPQEVIQKEEGDKGEGKEEIAVSEAKDEKQNLAPQQISTPIESAVTPPIVQGVTPPKAETKETPPQPPQSGVKESVSEKEFEETIKKGLVSLLLPHKDAIREAEGIDVTKGNLSLEEANRLFNKYVRKLNEEKTSQEQTPSQVEDKQRFKELVNSEGDITDEELQGFKGNEAKRKAGEYIKAGVKYVRNKVKSGIKGKGGRVKFANNVYEDFTYELVEAEDVQPSHMGGAENPYYFIPEAQHKRRVNEDSLLAENAIATDPKIEELGESVSAYDGAPIVNERNEVIQGNNRAAGIREGYKRNSKLYKERLAGVAEEYGFTAEQVNKMKEPILVRKVKVDDNRAIKLGNYSVLDKETGGDERFSPQRVIVRMTENEKIMLLNVLFSGDEDYDTIKEAINANIDEVYGIIQKQLNPAEQQSMFKNGKIKETAINDLEELVKLFLFQGADSQTRTMFEDLSETQKKGLYKALPYILNVDAKKSILPEVHEVIKILSEFYNRPASDASVKGRSNPVKNFNSWLLQMDFIEEGKSPSERYKPIVIDIARKLVKKDLAQKDVKRIFAKYSELVNGREADLFREATPPLTKGEAIKKLIKEVEVEEKAEAKAKGVTNGNIKNKKLQGRREKQQDKEQGDATAGAIRDKAEAIVDKAKSNEEAKLVEAVKEAEELIKVIDEIQEGKLTPSEQESAVKPKTTDKPEATPEQESADKPKTTVKPEATPEQESADKVGETPKATTKEEERKKALAETDKEIMDAIKEFDKVWNSIGKKMLSSIVPIDPELIVATGKIVNAYFKKGIYKFRYIVEDLYSKYGEKLKDIYEALKQSYINLSKGLSDAEYSKVDNIDNLEISDIIGGKNEKQERTTGEGDARSGGDTKANAIKPEERPAGASSVDRRLVISEQESIPDFDERVGKGKYKIDEVQRAGVNLVLHSFESGNKGFLLADGVGVGKTREILVIAEEMRVKTKKKILIVTHSDNVIDQFKKEAKELGIDINNFEIGHYTKLSGEKIGGGDYALAVFDEAHNLKNQLTLKSQAAGKVIADNILYVTATPMDTIESSIYFIKTLTGMSDEDLFRRLGLRADRVEGNKIVYVLDKGATYSTVLNELIKIRQELVKQGKYLRREYPFFGSIQILHVEQPRSFSAEEDKIDKHYQNKIKGVFQSSRYSKEKKKHIMIKLGALRNFEMQRLNELAKLAVTVTNTIRDISRGKKVVVFAESINKTTLKGLKENNEKDGFIEKFVEILESKGVKVGKIYGDDIKEKIKEKEKFQNGEYDVIIGTPQSMSTGIDLDDQVGNKPRVAYIVTSNYSGNINEQMLGRVSRRNTKSKAEVFYIVNNSIADTKRLAIVERKIRTLQAIQRGRISDEASLVSQMQEERKDPIEIKKLSDGRYIIRGQTFQIRGEIKDKLEGKWNPQIGGWIIPGHKYKDAMEMLGRDEEGNPLFQKKGEASEVESTWEKMDKKEKQEILEELTQMVADEWSIEFADLSKDNAKGVTYLLNKAMSFDPKTADATTFWEEAFHQSTVALAKEEDARKLLIEAGWDGKGEIWEVSKNESLRDAHEKLAEEFIDWVKKSKKPTTMKEKFFSALRNLWNTISKTLYKAGFITKSGYFETLYSGDMKRAKRQRVSSAAEISIDTQGRVQFLQDALPEKLTKEQARELIKSGNINQADLSWNEVSEWVESQEGEIDKADLFNYIKDARLRYSSTPTKSNASGDNRREITLTNSKGKEHSKVTTSDIRNEDGTKTLKVSSIEKQASAKGEGWKKDTLRNLIRGSAKEGYSSVIFDKETLSDEDVRFLFRFARKWGNKFGKVEINGKEYYGIPINLYMQSLSIYEGAPVYITEQDPLIDIAEDIYYDLKSKNGKADVYSQWKEEVRKLNGDLTALEIRSLWKKVREGKREVIDAQTHKEIKERQSGVLSPITNETIDNSDVFTFGEPKLLQSLPNNAVENSLESPTVKIIKGDTKLDRAKRFFNEFITPPPAEAELNSRFSPFYRIAEKYLNRLFVRDQNKIIKERLNGFKDIRNLNEKEAEELINIVSEYHYERYMETLQGLPVMTLGIDELLAKYSPSQKVREVLKQIHFAGEDALELIMQGEKERLILFTKEISRHLDIDDKEFQEAFPEVVLMLRPDAVSSPYTALDGIWKTNPIIRAKIANYLVEKKYESWKNKFYMNLSRPLEKDHYIVALHKEWTHPGQKEKIFTYFETEKEAKKYVEDMLKLGWNLTFNIHKLEDALRNKDFKKHLSYSTVMDLINLSNIPIPQDVIEEFLKRVKEGHWEKHTIRRNYTLGMKWTLEEIEQNLVNLLEESSGNKNKILGFALLDKELSELEGEYQDTLLRGDQKTVKELKTTLQYARKFASGIKLADNELLNQIRGVMYLWDLGFFRPSFLLQQTLENFQTVMNLAIAEGGFIEGEKAFITSGKESAEMILALIEEKLGKDYKGNNQELWDIITELRYMEKVSPLGVKVLMGESGDPKTHYDTYKNTFEIIKNMLGSGGQAIEYLTRIQAAVTFYKIAKQKGITEKDAIIDYISNMLDLSKANYSKTGSIVALNPKKQPQINERTIGRMLSQTYLVYKKWAAANTGLYRLLWERSKVAFFTKFLVGLGLHGIKKFPIFYGLYGIVSMILGLFDEELDKEVQEIEDKLNKEVGGKVGSVLNRGVGTYFGVDASKLFQEASALPTDLIADRIKDTESMRRLLSTSGMLVAETVLGRPYTFLEDLAVATSAAGKLTLYDLSEKEKVSETKYLSLFLPATFKGIVRANAMKEEGLKVAGKNVMRPSQITKEDLLATRLTFTPERISKKIEMVKSINGTVNKETKKAISLIKRGNISGAENVLYKLWEDMDKINAYTDYQIDKITTFRKFIIHFVLPKLSEKDRDFLKEYI